MPDCAGAMPRSHRALRRSLCRNCAPSTITGCPHREQKRGRSKKSASGTEGKRSVADPHRVPFFKGASLTRSPRTKVPFWLPRSRTWKLPPRDSIRRMMPRDRRIASTISLSVARPMVVSLAVAPESGCRKHRSERPRRSSRATRAARRRTATDRIPLHRRRRPALRADGNSAHSRQCGCDRRRAASRSRSVRR